MITPDVQAVRVQVPPARPGKLYVVPVVLVLLAYTVSFRLLSPAAGSAGFDEVAFLRDPSRLIVLGTAYLLAAVLLLGRLADTLAAVRRHWPYAVFLFYVAASVLWSAHWIKVLINLGHYLGMALVVLTGLLYFRDRPYTVFAVLRWVLAGVIALSIAAALIVPALGVHPLTGRWQGVTGNPNTLGIVCMVSVWANWVLWNAPPSDGRRTATLALLVMTAVGLFGTGSLTSCLLALLLLVAVPLLARWHGYAPARRLVVVLALLWFALMGLVALYVFAPGWLEPEAVLGGIGKDATLTGRTVIWALGLEALLQRPVLGWGFDSLASVFSAGLALTGQLHNGYLDLAVRGGGIALVFAATMFMRLLRLARCPAAVDDAALGQAFTAIVVAILLHNLVESSIFRSTHLLWFIVLYAYVYLDWARHAEVSAPHRACPADGGAARPVVAYSLASGEGT